MLSAEALPSLASSEQRGQPELLQGSAARCTAQLHSKPAALRPSAYSTHRTALLLQAAPTPTAAACRDAQLARQRGQQDQERTEPGVEAVVDVAPLAGRLVLFLSGAVEHAVLPTMGAERVAITAWLQ